ncbi:hypothetical protein FDB40_17210 [Clostridium botulinum]|nr:hypothetical protein [Clostridium botulinum]
MELYKPYRVILFNEKILNSFLRELYKKEKLSDKTIQQYYNSVLDFDLYLIFICGNWDSICDYDFELFRKILKRMNVTNRGINSRISHIKKFKEYYDIN